MMVVVEVRRSRLVFCLLVGPALNLSRTPVGSSSEAEARRPKSGTPPPLFCNPETGRWAAYPVASSDRSSAWDGFRLWLRTLRRGRGGLPCRSPHSLALSSASTWDLCVCVSVCFVCVGGYSGLSASLLLVKRRFFSACSSVSLPSRGGPMYFGGGCARFLRQAIG